MIVSRDLELPDGYQRFDWEWEEGVHVDDLEAMERELFDRKSPIPLTLYTQHQIFLEDGVMKQTRSSPNWDGGLVTFATCKHLLRSYDRHWRGSWLAGVAPKKLADNTLLFCGRIDEVFASNYQLGQRVKEIDESLFDVKSALTNPRGDLYTPLYEPLLGAERFKHANFVPPSMHTRSVESYDKSPGSVEGVVPKWWRDIEYVMHGRHPQVFILRPCFIFSRPMVWTSFIPGRAARNLSIGEFRRSLRRVR